MLHVASNSLSDILIPVLLLETITKEGEIPSQGHTANNWGTVTQDSGKRRVGDTHFSQ